MTTPTPHPLAIEAAEKIVQTGYIENVTNQEQAHVAQLIHTAALQPVIEAGEEIGRYAWHNPVCAKGVFAGQECHCGFEQAVQKWIAVVNPQSGGAPKIETKAPSSL